MKIIIKQNVVIVDDDFRNIMYVNSIDRSHRHNAMNYIRKDLNQTYNMDMVCREQGESKSVVFALLLITVQKPTHQEILQKFKQYGDFDIVVKTERSTFLNFQNYKDAKQALHGSSFGVPIGSLMVRPVAIQHTKMLMQFEQNLQRNKESYKEQNFMNIQDVKEFVSDYRAMNNFDMRWENDDIMVEECSKLVVDLYGWVYFKESLMFIPENAVDYAKECEDHNNAINNSKHSFINAVKKSVVPVPREVESVVEVVVESVVEVVVESVVEVAVNNNFDVVICDKKNVHVQQKFVNELSRLEIDFFGEVSTNETKTDARLIKLEECLCLSKDGFDVQERILHISNNVKKLSKWLDFQEANVEI